MRLVNRIPGILISLVIAVTAIGPVQSQDTALDGQSTRGDVSSLIDALQSISEGDIGYMPNVSGSGFLPLGKSEPGAMLLGSTDPRARSLEKPAGRSDALRELVKHGAAAVPDLVAHLDDKRPTEITVKHEAMIGGMFFDDEYDHNSRTLKHAPEGVNREMGSGEDQPNAHTVTVGDLCFVAIGQIVNRRFSAVRYQPTMCIMVNSPTYSEALRKAIKREWGGLTPEQHKASLERDLLQPDSEDRRAGACLRLGYYYPDLLESLALRQLAEPRYNVFDVQTLVREKLYHAKDARERQRLLAEFVAKRGEVARQGVLLYIWGDFELQESAEEGRCDASLKTKYPARDCLIELFGYPKGVKSKERPQVFPVENCAQGRFIDVLASFPSPRIDQAVLRIMQSTNEINLLESCARYLAGRGADGEIRKTVERCLKEADHEKHEDAAKRFHGRLKAVLQMQGWTPLHRAAQLGEPDRLAELLAKGAEVNARAANGRTPLHVAVDRGNYEAVRVLLAHKADLRAKNSDGQTPMDMAKEKGDNNIIRLLRETR